MDIFTKSLFTQDAGDNIRENGFPPLEQGATVENYALKTSQYIFFLLGTLEGNEGSVLRENVEDSQQHRKNNHTEHFKL